MSKLVETALVGAVAAGVASSSALAQQTPPQTLPPVIVQPAPEKAPLLRPKAKKQSHAPSHAARTQTPVRPVRARPTPPPPFQPVVTERDVSEPVAPTPQPLSSLLSGAVATGESLRATQPAESDTASLLRGTTPGYQVATGGGVSNLPVINGLADQRIGVELNGMLITSACANHMNPPLSYTDPGNVGKVEVTTGLAPVSKAGDAIGGHIAVESAPANFASVPGELLTAGSLTAFYRSNGNAVGTSAWAEAATSNLSVRYNGSWSRSENYEDGAGRKVLSTEYETTNHTLTFNAVNGSDLFTFQAGLQHIPYQAYVNQYMDMVGNDAYFFNLRSLTHFDWGTLDARAFYQYTRHEMGFLADKQPKNMPMDTKGQDFGYSLKAELPVSPRDRVVIGNEFHGQTLDDWWPPVPGSMMMMEPLTYWNINGGTRNRVGTFAEWEHKWTPQWGSLIGVRNDVVWMDTGPVQPYNWDNPIKMGGGMSMGMGMDSMPNPDADAARLFNARDRARTDVNFDMTALTRYEPDASESFELGYARKTRSPSLYERYSWGVGQMASDMVGWFGDLNGYTGNLDLVPEVAHTVSGTAAWRSTVPNEWEVKVTPYYSYVQDFIDVDRLTTWKNGTALLQFANHDAQLYGVNVSGRSLVWRDPDYGRFDVTGLVGWVRGERLDGGDLYHMMPLNTQLALTHTFGRWSSAVELQLAADKVLVDERRNEPTTPGYALVNVRTQYEWDNFRINLAVENLFDQLYYLPLGGAYYAALESSGQVPVPGTGRSVNAAFTVKF